MRGNPQEHSYLCASCTLGQAIFLSLIGDDGFRPAATQPKQTGDADRPHPPTVSLGVSAMNGRVAAIVSSEKR
jgi:hypothetical protein